MRVLLVVHGFPPGAQGGTETYAQAHASALRRLFEDDVFVLTREQDPNRPEYDVRTEQGADGLVVARVNNTFRISRTVADAWRNDAIGAIAARLMDDFKPDVAHIHHLTCLSTTLVAALAARHVPTFMTLHDYWLLCHRGQLIDVDYRLCPGPEPDGCRSCLGMAGASGRRGFVAASFLRELERRLAPGAVATLRRIAVRAAARSGRHVESQRESRARLEHMRRVSEDVTHFLAPSRYLRDRFIRFGLPPERITLSEYGFDHRPFSGLSRTVTSRLRLGFLGSLMISKAPHVLLEAFRDLPPATASLDLFGARTSYHGDDSYRARLDPLLRIEGVCLHPALPHDRVPNALASIDVLVVPSVWPENSPLVIREAFLAGVPVVASRIGGIPEIVEHGRNGLLVTPGDVDELRRALQLLARDPALVASLRKGIPPVRTIDDDVASLRRMYQSFRTSGPPSTWGPPAPLDVARGDEGTPEESENTRRASGAPAAPPEARPDRIEAIVLNYAAPDDTLLAVKSILASRRPVHDLIVVDNDTGDRCRTVLGPVLRELTYLQTGHNLGFSAGMNVGIDCAMSRGASHVLIVNSDAIVPPDCLDALLRALRSEPRAGVVSPVVLWRTEPNRVASLGITYDPRTGRMRHREYAAAFAALSVPSVSVVDAVSGCVMLVRREVFDAAGRFAEDYFFGFEDLDFCLRARRAGFLSIVAGEAVALHEGGRSIGARSPRRLYFAARNHLLFARRAAPEAGRLAHLARTSSIVLLNLAHAVTMGGDTLPARLTAVACGVRDYASGRFGAGPGSSPVSNA
jgi:GT2 family glycosyltransferase/glycosyltransferase involved in cell wall biosynthesis